MGIHHWTDAEYEGHVEVFVLRAGADAFAVGAPQSENPWPESSDAAVQLRREAWAAGWRSSFTSRGSQGMVKLNAFLDRLHAR